MFLPLLQKSLDPEKIMVLEPKTLSSTYLHNFKYLNETPFVFYITET